MSENPWIYKMGDKQLKFVRKSIIKNISRVENNIIRLNNQIDEIDALVSKRYLHKEKLKKDSLNPKSHKY